MLDLQEQPGRKPKAYRSALATPALTSPAMQKPRVERDTVADAFSLFATGQSETPSIIPIAGAAAFAGVQSAPSPGAGTDPKKQLELAQIEAARRNRLGLTA
ncbi:MAG: hypothetical protein JO126_02185 [Alphaproteobacteria bacterium]|nr:hypothetical protein [Alphaproteobacteria bacterium]MBV8548248.1 hypothetical protein [Alphaproteobacteria bacterium]